MRTTQLIKSAEYYLDAKMCGEKVLMKHAYGMIKRTHKEQQGHTHHDLQCAVSLFPKMRDNSSPRVARGRCSTDLLLRLHVQLVPRHQLEHVLQGQRQELLRRGHLHKVLVREAGGRVVQQGAHHGLGELADAQAVLGVKPFGMREGEKKEVKRRNVILCHS